MIIESYKAKRYCKAAIWAVGIFAAVAVVVALAFAFMRYPLITEDIQFDHMQDVNTEWTIVGGPNAGQSVGPGSLATSATTEENGSSLRTVTIRRDLSDYQGPLQSILFQNYGQRIVVKINDEIVYSLNQIERPTDVRVIGLSRIDLSQHNAIRSIDITLTSLTGDPIMVPNVMVGTHEAANLYILKRETVTILVLMTFAVLTMALLGTMLFTSLRSILDRRIWTLAIFFILAMAWAFCDSSLRLFVPFNEAALCYISYYALMCFPVPIVLFVMDSCKRRYFELEILCFIGFLNVAVQAVLNTLGIASLRGMLPLTHAAIALSTAACVWVLLKEKRAKDNAIASPLLVAFAVIAVTTVVCLVLYWVEDTVRYLPAMMIGVAAFLVLLLYAIMQAYAERLHEQQRKINDLRIYQNLSLYDAMTGLMNRRAFDGRLRQIESSELDVTDAVLVFLDVNGLKFVNDNFGHRMGDEVLKQAASVIREVFEPYGDCYRIGGDEYAVIMLNYAGDEFKLFDELRQAEAHYNETAATYLSIAVGCAHLVDAEGQRLTCSAWMSAADAAMYVEKLAAREEFRERQRLMLEMSERADMAPADERRARDR